MQNVFPAQKCPASLLKFVEKRLPVDKSILVRGVRLEIGWRGEGDWGFCMEESRHSSLNSHLLYQQNHLGGKEQHCMGDHSDCAVLNILIIQ